MIAFEEVEIMGSPQKVTVIIPNYNGAKYLSDCLNSLTRQSYSDFNVFIVDNASADDSVQLIRTSFPQFTLIENKENAGFSKAVNQAARMVDEGLLIIINNDTVCDPNWLEELVKFADEHEDFGSCQSKIMLYGTDKVNTVGNEVFFLGHGWSGGYGEPGEHYSTNKEVTYCSGASMMVRKDVLEKAGYFDDEEVFMYHDDLDLGWHLRLLGYKNYVAPGSVIYHKYQYSRNTKKYYFLEVSRLVCLKKYYRMKTLILLFPAMVLMEACTLLFSLMQGWFPDKLRSYVYILSNLPRLLRKRKAVQKQRVVTDRDILEHFKGSLTFPELDSVFLRIANGFFQAYYRFVMIFV